MRLRPELQGVPVAYSAMHGVGGDTLVAAFDRAGLPTPFVAHLEKTCALAHGAWVEARVELAETLGEIAFLSRGVKVGQKVVTQGAADLFGTEFGAGH